MATLTTNAVSNLGLRFDNLLVAAAGGGDECITGPGIFLVVRNTDASSKTVTLATPQVVDGDLAVADRTFTIAATTGMSVIPVPHLYRGTNGRAAITYSAVTNVTVGCFAMSTS